jgi:hypothetical protein
MEHHSDNKIAAQSAAHHLKTWILNAEVGNASKQGRYDYEALHNRASLALKDTSSSYRIQLFDSIVSHPKIFDFCSLYAIYQNNDLQASLLIRNN